MIRPEIDLELSIKALEAYGIEPNIIKSMLSNFKKIVNKNCNLQNVINWVEFDFQKFETRPPKYGKYLITRKDGKIHWETWNGIGWAYNHNEILYWAEIKPPCL